MAESLPTMLHVKDVAQALGLCPRSVRRLIKRGGPSAHRVHRLPRSPSPEFEAD